MNNHRYAEVLVREGIRQDTTPTAAPITYPIGSTAGDQTADMLALIEDIRAALGAGNVETAIRGAHLVGGRAARQGGSQVASLVRHAVRGVRMGMLDGASELLSQAHRELSTADAGR
jgi:hypothetical protein